MEFYRNKKKSTMLILSCSGFLLLLVAAFLYSIGLFTGEISAKLAGISGIFGLILIIVIIRMLMSINQSAPLLTLSKDGINSKTTPVSKAAGLIPWKDIIGIDLQKVGWDMLIMLTVERADYHMPIIKKKLSSMAVSDAKDANGNLQIFMTASELDIEADELITIIKDYRKTLS
ncbi:MAG: hypothetical protein EOO92_17285 [Pedobacter sp.]|nr:MAG: hypothetical protein EOO92_17285 [Pedobacter sp.]